MAVDTQTVVADALMEPFTTHYREPARFGTSEPWGKICFAQDSATLDGSGVGDTPQLRLEMPLPPNFVYRLTDFWVMLASSDATDVASWERANIETYVACSPQTPFTRTVQMNVPCNQAIVATQAASGLNVVFTPGGGSASTFANLDTYGALGAGATVPLVYGYPPSLSTGPVFNVSSATTAVAAGTFSYYISWLAFNVEQANHSGLHWQVPVT